MPLRHYPSDSMAIFMFTINLLNHYFGPIFSHINYRPDLMVTELVLNGGESIRVTDLYLADNTDMQFLADLAHTLQLMNREIYAEYNTLQDASKLSGSPIPRSRLPIDCSVQVLKAICDLDHK